MTSARPIAEREDQAEWPSTGGATNTTSTGQGAGVSRIVTVWRGFLESFAPPLGYEDENGFHYGCEPNRE
jgi:hypothetical protein